MEGGTIPHEDRQCETEEQKNQRNKTCQKSLRLYVREFCEVSTIQGLSYIVKKSHWLERIWWITIFILSIYASFYMVNDILDKWLTSPVLVSLATKEMAISEVPFPAVTICPEAKISHECLNYTKILRARKKGKILDTDPQENTYFDYMSLLCKAENHEGTFSVLNKLLDHVLLNIDDYMDDAPTNSSVEYNNVDTEYYSEFFSNCSSVNLETTACMWMNKAVDCKKVLTPIMTDEGLCYTFNMYDVRDIYNDLNKMTYFTEGNRKKNWDPDNGYRKKDPDSLVNMYPRRAFMSGSSNAFVVVFLTSKKDLNYACRDFATQGIRVTLHSPTRLPRPSQVFFTVGLNQITTAAVTPTLTETSKKIKQYDPEKRNCYFNTEKKLRFFRYYSQSNCNLECFTNYTRNKCGCVNFFMPKDNETNVCDLVKRFCLKDARVDYNQDILKVRLNMNKSDVKELSTCDCKPLCSDLQYNAEISSGDWDFNNPDDADYDNFEKFFEGYYGSAVKVFFKNTYFLPARRDELYGRTDMISNIGGALGLIIGFSLVSLAEIVYFLSLKLVDNLRLHGNWSGKINK